MKYGPPAKSVGFALQRRKVQRSIQRAAEEHAYAMIRPHVVDKVAPRPGSLARALYDQHLEYVRDAGGELALVDAVLSR